MRCRTIAAALLFAAMSYPVSAQDTTDHGAHHTEQDQAPLTRQTESPAGQSAEQQGMMRGRDMMGMMGGGMKEQGMVGAAGMGSSIMFRMIFALMDADSDGTVSLPEFQSAHERIFKAMDSNKDGKLTVEEMLSFLSGIKSKVSRQ
ncbi:EF-hand domain-containing protein [Bradyrhizobium sp. CCBAU 53338]|uniref:EF-hand domain-containing protein n=1 Tax=Bradyrhizobium sp. CCBAU 53338 TaxID=1325111 RepID=UPI00188CF68C|nr:EF-hand domain-containing protein [Bradyrhizobium sp. CCBAU 53338]QOZ53924.1 EF-hand domain-containing protein [Bradyrhizobium sp. CCBAU 53338]